MCSHARTVSGFTEFCFPCMHVIDGLRPVRYVRRDGTDWLFDCGEPDHFGAADWSFVHTFHLLDSDPSLLALAGLRPGAQALRRAIGAPWLRLEL